ncbi:DUF3794 and LysM peptidoglycan-binding domain-containing protein [Ruminiclostridium cellulolyticum]|uniref:Peptidoglycan-binding LysM n=1 Tax=Ruminiclostridium cellulolyticum (strain ATCC 35319 / DSM 5812 / JCM 6584 / H10) TaxID=394503 RepID=B8I3T2_RUMCH|nr:SPOCS domain-containing protein [Ruminiclostridium cellulolyticum]ACL74409.1 Peptidoglycan-binding LysM [Ruminiclostridium cellulolyticum H10]
MSLELLKQAFKVSNLLGEDTIDNVIENDIIVPDVKPDIAKILLLDGDVFVTGCDTGTDRAVVSGCLLVKILYISEDENRSVKSITTNIPFSYTLDIPGVRSGVKSRAKGTIEHIDYTLLNERKVNIKAIISINCKVTDEIEREISSGITGIDDIQVLKDDIDINTYLGSNKVNFILKEDMELPSTKPSVAEILRNDLKISGKDFKITDGNVVVKGDINIATLYIADDETRSMQYMENELTFTQFIELEDVKEDTSVNVDFDLIDYKIEPFEDSDGENRNLRAEATINIYVTGLCKRSYEVLSDAYSPIIRINLEKQQFSIDETVSENRSQLIVKDTLNFEDFNPEVREIFNVISRCSVSETHLEDEKLNIEGSVLNNVIYLSNDEEQPVFCHSKEIPFKHVVEIKGLKNDMKVDTNVEIEHCNYSMLSSDQVEIRCAIGINARVETNKVIPIINKATEGIIDEKKLLSMPSVIIYIVQPGDSLWKIAKKYSTTVENLLMVNNLNDKDVLMPGQQLLILKRAM